MDESGGESHSEFESSIDEEELLAW